MIKKTIYAVLLCLLLFVGCGYLLPGKVRVERSVEIQRPVTTLYTVLNRAGSYPEWLSGPGAERRLTIQPDAPGSGVGAQVDWSGDPRQWGTGTMEIIESRPGSLVRSRVSIQGQGQAQSDIHFRRVAGGARLTWVVQSDLAGGRGVFGSLVARYFGLLFDRWAGAEMEKTLASFTDYAYRLPATDFSGLEVERFNAESLDVLYVHGAAGRRYEAAGSPGLASAFREITAFMAANGIELVSQPMTLLHAESDGQVRLDAAIPVRRADIPASGNIRWGRSPSGPTIRAIHRGAYGGLSLTREKLQAWMAVHGYRPGAVSWEHYLSDPGITPLDERITHVCISFEE